MALLSAVAAQAATAIENGRLYRQLRTKADELDRMREFSENILESLERRAGRCSIANEPSRPLEPALEELLRRARTRTRSAARWPSCSTRRSSRCSRAGAVESPEGATLLPRAADDDGDEPARAGCWSTSAAAPLRDIGDDARSSARSVIVEDITDRVRLEEQLQISEKMASIGLLAAGVAHEVNTPLTGISSFTQMLLEGADPDDPRTTGLLEKIERQTFRAAKIVNGLLNLSRPGARSTSGRGATSTP